MKYIEWNFSIDIFNLIILYFYSMEYGVDNETKMRMIFRVLSLENQEDLLVRARQSHIDQKQLVLAVAEAVERPPKDTETTPEPPSVFISARKGGKIIVEP